MIARVFCMAISAWHGALSALDAGDLDGALAVYEQQIKPADRPYPPLNIFTDGASLLWRLALAGQSGLEPHWRDMAAYGEKYFPQAGAHFADVHHALAAAMTGSDALDIRLSQLEEREAAGKLAPGRTAIELCRGIKAIAGGDHDSAVRLLEPAISELARIGGSHAQRELWEDTLIVARLRAGHGDKAAKRISARLDRRPSMRDAAWLRRAYAQGLGFRHERRQRLTGSAGGMVRPTWSGATEYRRESAPIPSPSDSALRRPSVRDRRLGRVRRDPLPRQGSP